MPSPTQSEFSIDALPTNPSVEAPAIRPVDLENDRYPNGQPSVGTRGLRTLVRFLIVFCLGVSGTLAWQSYGDPARELIASSYPQLGWLAPQAEPVLQNAPDAIGLATPAVSSADRQQPNTILLDLDAVRQGIDRIATSIAASQGQITSSADRIATTQEQIADSVDRIATSQEQITRSVDQLAADREQMTREITRLQQIEQSVRSKTSEPSPRPASAPKPVARPASAPAPKPPSRASQEPTEP